MTEGSDTEAARTRRLLTDAINAAAARLGLDVHVTMGATGAPEWREVDAPAGRWGWLAPVTVEAEADGESDVVELHWPQRWTGLDPLPPDSEAVPGAHQGLYLGVALATGHGIRIRPGLHLIPRPVRGGWKVDPVLAPDLGREAFGSARSVAAALHGSAARYLSDGTRGLALDQLGAGRDADVAAIRAAIERHLGDGEPVAELVTTAAEARTSSHRNRLFGADEVFAELVFEVAVSRLAKAFGGERSEALTPRRVGRVLKIAAATAVTRMASGRSGVASVVSRSAGGGTLTAVEEGARSCFVGFRGLGKLRGRPDLRDLEAGWRGTLCPVQTPESTDVGLVRYTTVAQDEALAAHAEGLHEWRDLSASAALVPYINHNDPARSSLGAKNLKQAAPVVGAEPPVVATGWEAALGAAHGCVMSPTAGRVVEVTEADAGVIVVRDAAGRRSTVSFGAPRTFSSGPVQGWRHLVAEGDEVAAGQVLAHAADVRLDDATGRPELCLGVNALVALTPWHGLNHEDGIIVSRGLARRLTSWHQVRVDQRIQPGESVHLQLLAPNTDGEVEVESGEPLAVVQRPDGTAYRVLSPVTGTLTRVIRDEQRRTRGFLIRVRRALQVGDKLTNRHQGKGVVSAILDDDEMPTLPDGTPVEAILNPVGVLRRLNIGQLWEMHAGLDARLAGAGRVRAGRRLTPEGIARLASSLAEAGAPRGRMPLRLPDGRLLGGADGVVVGPQYLLKLDHLADAKLSVRGGQPWSVPTHGQPTQSRRLHGSRWVGSAQRLGEMEVWALEAAGAPVVLEDALHHRSGGGDWAWGRARSSLRAVQAHLAVAGLGLHPDDGRAWDLQAAARHAIATLRPAPLDWAGLEELPRWRDLGAEQKTTRHGDQDPLHDPSVHGAPGTADAERLRYYLPLPEPVPHPWLDGEVLDRVAVLPPAFRVRGPEGARRGVDRLIQGLADACLKFEKQLDGEDVPATAKARALVAWEVRTLIGPLPRGRTQPAADSIAGRLVGKRGLLRRYLLGQATLFSGRGVIVPDLTLSPDEVGLPSSMIAGLGIDRTEPEGDVVLVNRQPSLHPYNLLALRARPREGAAVRLHPLVLTMLAGDFDGDTVAVHRPTTHGARVEALDRLSPATFLRSRASGQPLAKADLDIALGLCLASDTQQGRAALAGLGVDRTGLTADDIPEVLEDVLRRYPVPGEALAALGRLEGIGFAEATGWSIGALDMAQDPDGGERLAQAVRAGAAGKASGVQQLLLRRGAVPGAHPRTPIVDVPDGFLRGLDSDDYFATAPGALASLAGKKLNSPHAGALTKTLVEVVDPLTVAADDCDVADALRSPLTCQASEGVCRACYGPLPGTDAPPEPGHRVGVLAAMSIGERSTQLSMKAHHGGGRAGEVEDGIGQLRAIFGFGRSEGAFGTRNGQVLTLRRYLDAAGDLGDPERRLAVFEPVLAHADAVLQGKVARVHVAVVLRQLLETYLVMPMGGPKGHRSLLACAQRRGRSAFEVATQRGNLIWLLGDHDGAGGVRTGLATGSVA